MFLSKKIVTLQGSVTKLSIYKEASDYDSNGTYITTFILNTQKVSSTNTHPPRLHENDKLIISGTINGGTLKSYAYRNLTKKSSFYGHFF